MIARGKLPKVAPIACMRKPRGTHVLTLTNPELGLSRRVKVTVPSGQVYRFDLRADEHGDDDTR